MSAVVVLVSADAEWRVVREHYPDVVLGKTPFGECFVVGVPEATHYEVVFFHGGWGKIAAAASTQYAIGRWQPELLINLGTCGGFEGLTQKGDIILAEQTIVYDIIEQMGDADEAIADYTTQINTAWAGKTLPKGVRRGLLLSADRDILRHELPHLKARYKGVAADWESGAIAWTAHTNNTPVLILRGVSDVVSEAAAEAYGEPAVFEAGTRAIMDKLLMQLPHWLHFWTRTTY